MHGPIGPEDVLDFWFADGPAVRREVWFKKSDAFDELCAPFAGATAAARDGAFDAWADTPRGMLALLILLDQFSRNLYRGSPLSYAADPKALCLARRAVRLGFDLALTPVERMFMYLPFEHSEDPDDQDESVRLFELLRPALGDETLRYTHAHRDVILTFGRFPHRNAVLGRVNTAEEDAYLAQPGAGF
jgi:uncharacterized protein (DUF924 family)